MGSANYYLKAKYKSTDDAREAADFLKGFFNMK